MGFLALCDGCELDDTTEAAARMHIRMPTAISKRNPLTPFHVRQVPDTIYLDAQGRTVAFDSGPQSKAHFEQQVQALLGK